MSTRPLLWVLGFASLGVCLSLSVGCGASHDAEDPSDSPRLPDDSRDDSKDASTGTQDGGASLGFTGQYVGGSRIKARHYAADGMEVFQTWRDVQLDTDCSFSRAADDKLRCLPTTTAVSSSVYFRDSACTAPAIPDSSPACTSSGFAQVRDMTTCPSRQHLHRVTERIPPGPSYFKKDGASCVAAGFEGSNMIALGPEIAATELVEGVERTGPEQGGVAPVAIATADGAAGLFRWQDVSRNAPCELQTAADGVVRCLPSTIGRTVTALYADANCSSAFIVGTAGCALDGPVVMTDSASCGANHRVFSAGAPINALYMKSGASCVRAPETILARAPMALFGPEVAAPTFATGNIVDRGTGRLKVREMTFAGGARAAVALFDTERNEACAFQASEGAIRCLPESVAVSGYSDSACTQPLAERLSTCSPPRYTSERDFMQCDRRIKSMRAAGSAVPGSYYTDFGGNCSSRSASTTNTNYRVEAAVPLTAFVSVITLDR